MIGSYAGLALAFFGLPIFRLASLSALVLLVAGAFLFAYHSRRIRR
jgi:hypothetical protein